MEAIRAEGVKYIFGNPGTSESPIMDELEAHPDLRYVLVLQEGVAMGMADGYARATGKPSFVNLHIETGLANGISLLNNSHAGGTPLVLTAANLDIRDLPRGRTDLAGMVEQFTKFTAEATHPEQVPTLIRRAFNEAKTPPMGPTFISFSANALDDEGEMEIDPSPEGYFNTAPDARAIDQAAEILGRASNPAMVVGDRVAESGATAGATRVAELVGAKVFATQYSAMNFPTSHPQFAGSIRLGFPDSLETLSVHDAVLVVGKLVSGYFMFSDPSMRYFVPGTKLVHMDVDGSQVGSTHATDVGIIADPKVGLSDLAEALEAGTSGSDREAAKGRATTLGEEKAAAREATRRRIEERWDQRPMTPSRMMAEVARALPKDAIIADDSVTTRSAVFEALDFDEPGSIYGNRGGALGWALGGPMGVKLANPDRPVVAVVGDGSAMMTVQGFWTAANENIPVVYVVCNNASYRVLKVNMDIYKDVVLKDGAKSEYIGMDFPQPMDLAGVASAMGVHSRRIEDPEEIGPAMQEALDLGKPAVLDVVIDGSL